MSWENRSVLLEEFLFSGFLPSVLFSPPKLPSSEAVCMQPDSCRKIKLDLIFNCMGSFEFGGDKSFMMQSPLFLCETKMGFSKCSVLWKVGSGFETPTSPRAPLYEKAVQKDNVWGMGAGCEGKGQNLRGSSSSSRVCAGLCLVCFSWMVLSLELWGFGYFIKN